MFADIEDSRSLGEPDSLYRFTMGDQVWLFTDAEDGFGLYLPVPIDRDAVNTSGTLDRSALAVRVAQDNPVAMLFRYSSPAEVVGLTIFQMHGSDEDRQPLAIWAGRVLSAKVEGSEAALNCEPVSTSMKRPGLRMRDQYQCMHALYGPSCRANRAEFTTVGRVQATGQGGFVTLADGWNGAFEETRFNNGIFKWTHEGRTEQRQILRVNAPLNRLQIEGRVVDLAAGMAVELSLGCSHNLSDCRDVFDNIHNFGGCPYIPKKNPIGFVNQFY